ALENAGRQPAAVYRSSVLYTTLSPCAMCSGAILLYGITRVIVGENQTFLGEESLLRSRGVTVEVVQDERCIRLMRTFIEEHPELWNEDIGFRLWTSSAAPPYTDPNGSEDPWFTITLEGGGSVR